MYERINNARVADAGVIAQSTVDDSQLHIPPHEQADIVTLCRIDYPL